MEKDIEQYMNTYLLGVDKDIKLSFSNVETMLKEMRFGYEAHYMKIL